MYEERQVVPIFLSRMQGDLCYTLQDYVVRLVDGLTCRTCNHSMTSEEGELFLPHIGAILAEHLLVQPDPARMFDAGSFCVQVGQNFCGHPDPDTHRHLRQRRLSVLELTWFWADHSAIRYRLSFRAEAGETGGTFTLPGDNLGYGTSFIMAISCKVRRVEGTVTSEQPYLNVRMRLRQV